MHSQRSILGLIKPFRHVSFSTSLCGLFVLGLILGHLACDSSCGRTVGKFDVTIRPVIVVVKDLGRFDVTASCLPGEQMLGGGYVLQEPAQLYRSLMVEASYPSAQNNWTTTIYNPDANANGSNSKTLMRADAYCLTTPSFPVGMQIVQSSPVTAAFNSRTTVTANCPAGSALTAGGFRTRPATDSDANANFAWSSSGLYNTWFFTSAPALDNAGRGTGWSVTQRFFGNQGNPPTTTAYALCSTNNLSASLPRNDGGKARHGWGFDEYDARVVCANDEFSPGGGFEISPAGDIWADLIPHLVFSNAALSDLAGHDLHGWYGYQSPSYQNPTTADFRVWATCLKVPQVYVTVKITSPADGSVLPTDPAQTNRTLPVTFAATASDAAGTPLTGAALQWAEDAQPLGSLGIGESFSATLPAPTSAVVSHRITVRATDSAGHSASDSITVQVGRIP